MRIARQFGRKSQVEMQVELASAIHPQRFVAGTAPDASLRRVKIQKKYIWMQCERIEAGGSGLTARHGTSRHGRMNYKKE